MNKPFIRKMSPVVGQIGNTTEPRQGYVKLTIEVNFPNVSDEEARARLKALQDKVDIIYGDTDSIRN